MNGQIHFNATMISTHTTHGEEFAIPILEAFFRGSIQFEILFQCVTRFVLGCHDNTSWRFANCKITPACRHIQSFADSPDFSMCSLPVISAFSLSSFLSCIADKLLADLLPLQPVTHLN